MKQRSMPARQAEWRRGKVCRVRSAGTACRARLSPLICFSEFFFFFFRRGVQNSVLP